MAIPGSTLQASRERVFPPPHPLERLGVRARTWLLLVSLTVFAECTVAFGALQRGFSDLSFVSLEKMSRLATLSAVSARRQELLTVPGAVAAFERGPARLRCLPVSLLRLRSPVGLRRSAPAGSSRWCTRTRRSCRGMGADINVLLRSHGEPVSLARSQWSRSRLGVTNDLDTPRPQTLDARSWIDHGVEHRPLDRVASERQVPVLRWQDRLGLLLVHHDEHLTHSRRWTRAGCNHPEYDSLTWSSLASVCSFAERWQPCDQRCAPQPRKIVRRATQRFPVHSVASRTDVC